jgi:hypothetical protein
MGAFDLLAKAAKGVKKAPFFSKVDEVLDSLPRNKGTGDEFLREIEKTKGVKPAEIQDRGIAKVLKGKPKMTKAEVQKIFESNPPPRVQEKVLTSEVTDYDEWLDAKALEMYGDEYHMLSRAEQSKLNKMYGELDLTQYDRYKTPGGENYREILLKLPVNTTNAKILEAGTNKTSGKPFVSFEFNGERYVVEKTPGETDQQAVSRRIGGMPERGKVSGSDTYISSHYKTDPNLLAHIRVQDFTTPEGKKVLLVDEIQSDWHQEGRKKGYKQEPKKSWLVKKPGDKVHGSYDSEEEATNAMQSLARAYGEEPRRLGLSIEEGIAPDYSGAVPDAPFKKNWHELAMKRVLDYAAENGYDTVAITPGAEQAKRYDLSQHIDNVVVTPFRAERGEYTLQAIGKDGRTVIDKNDVQLQDLDDYIGKDLADRARQQMVDFGKSNLTGVDLQVGGEGMKGFYDKILPDYLNSFGKQYGSQMGEINLNTAGDNPPSISVGSNGQYVVDHEGTLKTFKDVQQAEDYARSRLSKTAHSFDITPQMREQIQTKGQPLYGKVAMPALEGLAAGTGAATIGPEVFDTNNEQQVQNPVHFTENPDAMLLELMQRN